MSDVENVLWIGIQDDFVLTNHAVLCTYMNVFVLFIFLPLLPRNELTGLTKWLTKLKYSDLFANCN